MSNPFLPADLMKVGIPPIKCQGIKTKLVKFIAGNVQWDGEGKWVEPFLGSGVVLFNIQPQRALASDTNKYVIKFYQDIQSGTLNERIVGDYLMEMGSSLRHHGEKFYYKVREKFNLEGGSLEFLFLNRACFNGLIRFNSKGGFNVPFGRKPERFRQAYITKICNQVRWVREVLAGKEWEFRVCDWRETVEHANANDFLYLDPPYLGRHTDYFNNWSERDAIDLSHAAQSSPGGFGLSMWMQNRYRKNDHIAIHWEKGEVRTFNHFYHIGSKESLRNGMEEALVIKPGFAAPIAP